MYMHTIAVASLVPRLFLGERENRNSLVTRPRSGHARPSQHGSHPGPHRILEAIGAGEKVGSGLRDYAQA